jgi:hypothetical protein
MVARKSHAVPMVNVEVLLVLMWKKWSGLGIGTSDDAQ